MFQNIKYIRLKPLCSNYEKSISFSLSKIYKLTQQSLATDYYNMFTFHHVVLNTFLIFSPLYVMFRSSFSICSLTFSFFLFFLSCFFPCTKRKYLGYFLLYLNIVKMELIEIIEKQNFFLALFRRKTFNNDIFIFQIFFYIDL